MASLWLSSLWHVKYDYGLIAIAQRLRLDLDHFDPERTGKSLRLHSSGPVATRSGARAALRKAQAI